jgi:Ankyrin repeats (3 copies)
MVAAQYGRSAETIGLLLDRGARVQVTADGRPSPSYPLALAAHAGNASILERLHRAGDPADGAFGLSAASAGRIKPMAIAIRNGDLEVVRTLLDLGADVNGGAVDPWSPLESAVHNNGVALAAVHRARRQRERHRQNRLHAAAVRGVDRLRRHRDDGTTAQGWRTRRYQESRRKDSTRPRARVPTHTLRKYPGTRDRALTRQKPFNAVSTVGYSVTTGRALDVDAVIEGTFQRAAHRIRVTAQLESITGAHKSPSLWAETFDVELSEIFNVQDRISEKVAEAFKIHLSTERNGNS